MHPRLTPISARADVKAGPVVLRHPMADDFEALAEIRRDCSLQSMLLTVLDKVDDDAVRGWIQKRSTDPNGIFRVVAKSRTNDVLGFVQLTDIHHRNRLGWAGIALRRTAQGQGIGSVSLRLLHDLAAREENLRKILLHVRLDNRVALKLYETAGYRLVGNLMRHFHDKDGKFHDVVLLELMLPES